jgi:formate hydrogenlyase transcriptional activator
MLKPTIICVDDEPIILQSLKGQLRRTFGTKYSFEMLESGQEALEVLDELIESGVEVPMILADHLMPGMKGDELLVKVHSKYPKILKVMLTGQADAIAVGNALNEGNLYRFIAKPWQEEDLKLTIKEGVKSYFQEKKIEAQHQALKASFLKAQEEIKERKRAESELQKAISEIKKLQKQLTKENLYLKEEIQSEHNFKDIIGNSDEMKYVLYRVEQVATLDTTVLIQGETGTGKELIARAIHENSNRKDKLMVKVNCAAMPADLIESELFGHERGAFTGANQRKIGRFELAHNGTLFLDEIGELPLNLQAKLLRVIEYGEFERLGNSRSIKVDVRIVAATNRSLENEVEEGRFRKDLFYRLNVYPLTLPSLRKRKSDIPLLLNYFVGKITKKVGKEIKKIPQKTINLLMDYNWPGNIRELQNILERAIILSMGKTLEVEIPRLLNFISDELKPLDQMEREYIQKVLDSTNGKISGVKGAAEILGLHPNTLRSRIEKLGINTKNSV